MTTENFTARLKQENSATKTDIDDLVEKADFNDKLKLSSKNVTSNKTKHVKAEKKITAIAKRLNKYQKTDMVFVRQNVFFR